MNVRHRRGTRITLGGALALAAWLAASFVWVVGPVAAKTCGGGGHSISLTAGGVSPGSGTTATNFTFTVTFPDLGSDEGPAAMQLAQLLGTEHAAFG